MSKKIYLITTLFFVGFILSVFCYFPVKYKDEIVYCADKYSISPSLVYAIIRAESNFDTTAVSSVGACGLMQIMPSTAEYMIEYFDLDLDINELFSPAVNIELGCAYIRYLSNKFDNLDDVICAYNAGETIVKKWKKENAGIVYKETKNYLIKVKINSFFYQKRILANV